MSIIPPQVPGPVPGVGGHFAHHDWLTASVVALDGEAAPTGFITSIASVIVPATNWEVTSAMACRSGRWVEVALGVVYHGPSITVPTTGDVPNTEVGTLAAQWRPPVQRVRGSTLVPGNAGRLAAFGVDTSGIVRLGAVAGSAPVNGGDSWTLSGVWAVG